MRYAVLIALATTLVACGPATEIPLTDSQAPRESLAPGAKAPEKEFESAMIMKGVDLYMHDYTPTDGELRDPTFWVHAESGQLAEDEKIWALQSTRAVIYRDGDEDLVMEAREGWFDQERQVATLQGEVKLTAGSLVAELEELFWDNARGTATSDRPVRVTEGETRLSAEGLRITPDADSLVLRNGSGYVQLKKDRQ